MQIRKAILEVLSAQLLLERNGEKVDTMVRVDSGSEIFKRKDVTEEEDRADFLELQPVKPVSTTSTISQKQEEPNKESTTERRHSRRKHSKRRNSKHEKETEKRRDQNHKEESHPQERKQLVYSTTIGKPGSLQDFITSRRLTTSASGIFANTKLSRPVTRRKRSHVDIHHRKESDAVRTAIDESLQRIVHGSSRQTDDEKGTIENKENSGGSGASSIALEGKRPSSVGSTTRSVDKKPTPLKTPCTSLPFETPLAEISEYLKNSFNPKELFKGKDYFKDLQDSLRKICKQSMSIFEDTSEREANPNSTPSSGVPGTIRLQPRKSFLPRSIDTGHQEKDVPVKIQEGENRFGAYMEQENATTYSLNRPSGSTSTIVRSQAPVPLEGEHVNDVVEESTRDHAKFCNQTLDTFVKQKFYSGEPTEFCSGPEALSSHTVIPHEHGHGVKRKTISLEDAMETQTRDVLLPGYPKLMKRTNNDIHISIEEKPNCSEDGSMHWTDISNSTVSSILHGPETSSQDFLDYIDKFQSVSCMRLSEAGASLLSSIPAKPPADSPTPPREMYRMKMF